MAIFGWVILTLFTLYVTAIAIFTMVASVCLRGKTLGIIGNVVVTGTVWYLWYLVISLFPFIPI